MSKNLFCIVGICCIALFPQTSQAQTPSKWIFAIKVDDNEQKIITLSEKETKLPYFIIGWDCSITKTHTSITSDYKVFESRSIYCSKQNDTIATIASCFLDRPNIETHIIGITNYPNVARLVLSCKVD